METLGSRLARAIAAKDTSAFEELLAPDVDFRGLTPGRTWEATDPSGVSDVFFGSWFEPQDDITAVLDLAEREPVEDTAHVAYRFAITTPDGGHVAEQQVYYREHAGRISHLRVMCSGFRPVAR